MGYTLDGSPEELEPQASGSRRGGPPRHGTTVDLLDQPDRWFPKPLTLASLKKIAAIIGLSILLLGVSLLVFRIIWPG
jgi:hypothetical protein